MKILLLGSNGQLGTDIKTIHQTKHHRFQLIPLTRADVDVSQLDTIQEKLSNYEFDVLINCTSYHKTDEVEKKACMAMTINAHAVSEMAKICKKKKSRFLHISTDYVFGNNAGNSPLTETSITAPLNVYGASKLLGESLAFFNHADTIIFRVASLFGQAGASGKGGNFVETIIRLAKEKDNLTIVHDQHMSPTATIDVAKMIFSALENNIPAGIFHAVNTGEASWYEFARDIIKQTELNTAVSPVKATEFPSTAVRPNYSVLCNEKLPPYVGKIPTWQDALHRYLKVKGHLMLA